MHAIQIYNNYVTLLMIFLYLYQMNKYRHFYLYAKGHYPVSDRMSDLRRIQAQYSSSNPNDIGDWSIMCLFEDIIVDRFLADPQGLALFFRALMKNATRLDANTQSYTHNLAMEAIVDAVMLIMCESPASIIGDLGEPDQTIFAGINV